MTTRLEMNRVMDENDWLREELADAQRQLQEAVLELEDLREFKAQRDFEDEIKQIGSKSEVRPITPSKIPVGNWRVEEEKDINRALNGSRSASPAPSRIPTATTGRARSSAYKALMEKESAKKAQMLRSPSGSQLKQRPPQYFKLANGSNKSKIPGR